MAIPPEWPPDAPPYPGFENPWTWPPPIDSRPPYDPLMVEYWHAELGVSLVGGAVDSWTGQIRGTVLPFNGARPAYGPDGANFRGRPVIKCAGGAALRNPTIPTLVAAGTRPAVFSGFRYTAVPGINLTWSLFDMGVTAVADPFYLRWHTFVGPTEGFGLQGMGPVVIVANPLDTLQHRVWAWADGVNISVQLDSTLVAVAGAGSLGNNITAVGVGMAASGNYHQAQNNHAFHIVYSARPGAAHVAAVTAWAQYWGL